MLNLYAYAKINLTLDILGRRPDGYHQIASILQTIDLRDRLAFQIEDKLHLACNIPALSNEDNLAMKAAILLKEETDCHKGALIRLTKGIPLAAGLGGGSSDAAATLTGLNLLWDLGLSRDNLLEMASQLGSDVPFFLYGGTALVEERGEIVTPLPDIGQWWVVLLKPPIEIPEKTAKLYASLEPADFTCGQSTESLAALLRGGRELNHHLLSNAFERTAFKLFPGLSKYKERLLAAGAPQANLAGSGPILFALFKERPTGEKAYEKLRLQGMKAYFSKTIGPGRRAND